MIRHSLAEWNYAAKRMTEVPIWYRMHLFVLFMLFGLLMLCAGVVIGHWILR